MAIYAADSFRNVEADSFSEAAQVFFERLARRNHGSRGAVMAVAADHFADQGSQTFRGYVGTRGATGGVNGANEYITVNRISD